MDSDCFLTLFLCGIVSKPLEEKDLLVSHFVIYNAVYRTCTATLGLLIMEEESSE